MKIEVNIEKRHTIAIFIGLFLLSGSLIVYAYNPKGSADPAVFGHSVNEVFGAQVDIDSTPCPAGQGISRIINNGSIVCTRFIPTYSYYNFSFIPGQSKINDLGEHDICVLAAMELYDSESRESFEICRVYKDKNTRAWHIYGDSPELLRCASVCMDWT